MAELDIGKHCSQANCKQLDFLPFQCDGCGRTFCKQHQVKDRHECSRSLLTPTDRSSSAPYQTYSCSLSGCGRTELVPVPCDKCHSNYCMLHRHAADHSCAGIVAKAKYMSATAQHVKQIFDNKPVTQQKHSRVPKSKKAIEMAAKVALMKLKSSATGDPGVPPESRVYLNIQLPGDSVPPKYSACWMDQKLRLRSIADSSLVYEMEAKLTELIADSDLYSGSSVELCYIPEGVS